VTRGWVCVFLAALLAALAPALSGQNAQRGATISGRVVEPGERPVAGAAVEAREVGASSGAGAGTRTDAQGRYSLPVPAGREYALVVAKAGYISTSLLVEVPRAGAGPVRRIELASATRSPLVLESIVVRAPPRAPETARHGAAPGGDLWSNSAAGAAQYPGDPGDLVATAGISGQYVPVRGQELSIDGQPPSANRTTLDGSGFEGRELPPEALAASGVFAHPYDVSRGQFTGGELAGRTMSGTNLWGGALRLAVQEPRVPFGRTETPGWYRGFGQMRGGGGGGGPLVPGRLFVYAAAQAAFRDASAGSDPADASGWWVPADSLTRFRSVVEQLGAVAAGTGTARDRTTRAGTAIARFDWLPGAGQALMLRLDARGTRSSGGAASPLALTAGSGERALDRGALLSLTSRARAVENELSARRSLGWQRPDRSHPAPSGQVWVQSLADDGSASGETLSFGAAPVAMPGQLRSAFELADRAYLRLGGSGHQLLAGAAYSRDRVVQEGHADRYGTFTFRSLADLEAGRPLRFTRSLGDARGAVASGYAAVYAGDLWKVSDGLRLIAGLRGERYRYSAPGRAGPVESVFGLSTAPDASPWRLSPRVGFGWARHGAADDFSAQGGTGVFRGAAPTRALAAALAQAAAGSDVRLDCIGAGVPAPRWSEYALDAGTIPTECGSGGAAAGSGTPDLTGFASGYGAPRVWHSSLGATWLHRPSATALEVSVAATRGAGMALGSDRNLVDVPRFTLAGEGGRPVFVAPEDVDPATGQMTLQGSRRVEGYGIVREVGGGGRSAVEQVSVGGSRLTGLGLVRAYYTWARSRDQATGLAGPAGAWASTGGDPRRAEWGASDFEQRHALQLSATRRVAPWAGLSVIGRLLSGTPFTPLVESDVNGDGLANDRAFVFDPASSPDPALGEQMAGLLARSSGPVRACLARQMGRIAARNSCRTPWNAFLDLQLNLASRDVRSRRMVVGVTAQNVTAGFDYLLHGRGGLRAWGQYGIADPVLLRPTGFDPGTRTFRYAVNPGFGVDAARSRRVPFSLRIQARLTLGADPATQALAASVTSAQDRVDPERLRAEIVERWRNVPALVLAGDRRLRLGLTPRQAALLRGSADSVAAAVAALAGELARGTAAFSASSPAEVREGLERQAVSLARGQALLNGGVESARSILTAEQWARLPRWMREPPAATLPITPQGGISILPDM
jgi:hypothetical protein